MSFARMMSLRVVRLADACAPRTAWAAVGWYLALTLIMTWPLVTEAASGVPRDVGDPLLNCWILGWNAEHLLRVLGGDLGALSELWHGNIFYPERYVLAYSELLLAQSVQVLPVYAVTKNLVLCYNLLFLSTFVVSGLGMFLLTRALSGDWRAAFVAGALFAFAPYRAYQSAHLQVMSSQWMPFVLFGFHRACATTRVLPLFGAAVALVAQNLSCGYFLVFFSMFVPPFVLFEMIRHGRLRDVRMWLALLTAAGFVALMTLPAMQPYLALRETLDTRRALSELEPFSANTWSWLTSEDRFTVWGRWLAEVMPGPETRLFPGALPVALAGLGLWASFRRDWLGSDSTSLAALQPPGARYAWFGSHLLTWVGAVTMVSGVAAVLVVVAGAGGRYEVAGIEVRITNLTRGLYHTMAGVLVLLLASRRARAVAGASLRSPLTFALAASLVAWYLSLGPRPLAGSRPLGGPALYLWLYEHVPGFDGLRVPARFAMIAILFLSIAATWGARHVLRRRGAAAGLSAVALVGIWLVEAAMLPFPVGGQINSRIPGVRNVPRTVDTGSNVPAVYRFVRTLPEDAVLLELPLGDVGWEVRHVFYSTTHWRPLVNGYSGYFPPRWEALAEALSNPYRAPTEAWQRVTESGATHIIVHGDAYFDDEPPEPNAWLTEHGAVLMTTFGTDRVYLLPR